MIRFYLSVIALMWSTLMSAQNTMTWYAPPHIKLEIDTTEWEVLFDRPYIMNTLTFLMQGNTAPVIKDRKSNLEIRVQLVMGKIQPEAEMTIAAVSKFGKDVICGLPNFVMAKGSGYSFFRQINKHFLVCILTNVPDEKAKELDRLKELMKSFKWVETEEIDRFLSYPLSKAAGVSRLNYLSDVDFAFKSWGVSTGELKKMASVDTVNFDKNYFPDKRFNLTYKEFFEVYEKIHSGPIKGSEMHQFIFDNSDYSFGRIHKELFAKSAFCDVRELIYMLMGRRLDFETASSNNEYKLFHNDTIFYIAYKTYEGGEPFSSRHDIDYFYEVDITENSDEVRFENCPVEVILNDDYPYLLNQYQYTIASFENEPVFQGIPSITTSVREANLSKSIVWSDIELDKRYKMIVLYRQGYGSYYDAFIPGYEPEVVYNEWVYGFMEYGGWCIRSIAPQGITDQTKMKLNEIIHVSPPFYEDLDHDGVKEVFKVILCNGVIIDVQIYKKNNKQFEEIQTPNEQWLAWLGENPAYKNFLKITQVDKYRTGIPADKAHRHFLMGRKK